MLTAAIAAASISFETFATMVSLSCEWATTRLPHYPMHRGSKYMPRIPSRVREHYE
jgi:hypothetical protein